VNSQPDASAAEPLTYKSQLHTVHINSNQ